MNLLVDLDGVVFRTYEVIGKKYKKEFGKDLDWSVISDKDLKFWKTKYGKFLLKCFKDTKLNANLPIYKDADKVLRAFATKKGNEITICTARRKEIIGVTKDILQKYNIPYDNLIFISRKNVPATKVKVAKAFDIDLAVDDEAVNVKELSNICDVLHFNTNSIILFQAIYQDIENGGFVTDTIIGVRNWKEIKKYIL